VSVPLFHLAILLISDPRGNYLEFKSFKDVHSAFAR